MKLTDFDTLTEAQAHPEQGQKMVSPDMMVAFMATFGHVASVMDSTSESARALQLALQFGSEFNLITGHPASVKPLLDSMVAESELGQPFADYAVAYANPITFPFASVTQEEFDAAKAELTTLGSSEAVVSYDQVDSVQQSYTRGNSSKTKIEIAIASSVTYDTKAKVYVSEPSGITGEYIERPTAIASILIKAGDNETVLLLEQNYGRRTQYRIVSDRVDSLTALVTSISKY